MSKNNKMRKQILYILCRNQLIRVYLKRIKDEKDTLAMYQKMSAINWQLSKTLENSYKKQFDAKRAAEELAQKAKKAAEAEENRPKYLSNRAQNILFFFITYNFVKKEIFNIFVKIFLFL